MGQHRRNRLARAGSKIFLSPKISMQKLRMSSKLWRQITRKKTLAGICAFLSIIIISYASVSYVTPLELKPSHGPAPIPSPPRPLKAKVLYDYFPGVYPAFVNIFFSYEFKKGQNVTVTYRVPGENPLTSMIIQGPNSPIESFRDKDSVSYIFTVQEDGLYKLYIYSERWLHCESEGQIPNCSLKPSDVPPLYDYGEPFRVQAAVLCEGC